MDMGFSEIQQMLKNSAREFLAQECPLTLVRELENDARGFSEDIWRQVVNLGWTGIPFPEQYGGTGGSFLDLAVLVEEMGRALLPAPFFATVVPGRPDRAGCRQRRTEAEHSDRRLRWNRAPDAGAH